MNFDRHLKILKEHYGSAKPFSTANHPEGQVEPMLSPTTLLLACGGASTTTLSYDTHYLSSSR
jgi:hypothetical protein